jgi:hypothetical protein
MGPGNPLTRNQRFEWKRIIANRKEEGIDLRIVMMQTTPGISHARANENTIELLLPQSI